jgi:DNA transformation protein and related proteins
MAVTDSFVAYVVEQLEPVGAITPRRMFGGVGVYAGDLFFALIDDDVLYFKVDDSNRGDFERAGSGPFRPYGPGGEVMQYYTVPALVLEDADELARWAAKAIAVARAKKDRPKKRAAKSSSRGRRKSR